MRRGSEYSKNTPASESILSFTFWTLFLVIFMDPKYVFIHVPLPIEAGSPDELAVPHVADAATSAFLESGAQTKNCQVRHFRFKIRFEPNFSFELPVEKMANAGDGFKRKGL